MPIQSPTNRASIHSFIRFLFFSTLFAVAYTQSPLYTSNQNQYFLHGFANAGIGSLEGDWLANTLDPTPVFSILVSTTIRYFRTESLFYIYYAFLMGIYLFSLLGITSTIFKIAPWKTNKPSNKYILLMALILLVHSAGLRFTLSRTLGVDWTYVLEDGVAHQRMLGPVFQPSSFGVLLLLSIYLFLQDKPYLAVLAATLAATLHPTYLLSAATLTFTFILATYLTDKKIRRPVLIGVLALLSILPILYYTYTIFGSTSPELTAQAREILVTIRIPHHAIISQWFNPASVVKIIIVAAALFLVRKTPLFLILWISTLVAAIPTIAQIFLKDNTLALLFPWRLSIYILPLSMTLLLAQLADWITHSKRLKLEQYPKALYTSGIALISLTVLIGSIRFTLDLERKANSPERSLQKYVYAHKSPGETYLVPVKMQDFRLVSGAPVFVDFKSIPYKDIDVLEWYRREKLAERFYQDANCTSLESLASAENLTHLVLDLNKFDLECSSINEEYRDRNFALYSIEPDKPQ